ncbi:MAG: acyltransferase [Oscillospiraceae bacterium]|nr:acyltransferase [Oscillospiraceae bacterium]
MNSFYTSDELSALGLKTFGENVLISRKCSIYAAGKVSVGSHVRIDDFCILSGNIEIGSYIHISAYTSLYAGSYKIQLGDFCTVSSRCAIYAESDDYSGECMTNPMVPEECRTTYGGDVILKQHAIIGSASTVLPDITIGEGASIGTMSLVNKDVPAWSVCVGIPCKKIKERSKNLLKMLPHGYVRGNL